MIQLLQEYFIDNQYENNQYIDKLVTTLFAIEPVVMRENFLKVLSQLRTVAKPPIEKSLQTNLLKNLSQFTAAEMIKLYENLAVVRHIILNLLKKLPVI